MASRFLKTSFSSLLLLTLSACGAYEQRSGILKDLTPDEPPPQGALVVTADEGGSLTVTDNSRKTVLYAIPVDGAPAGIVSAGDGSTVYVSVNRAGAVDVVLKMDVRARQELARIEVGTGANLGSLALLPDGKRLAVTAVGTSEIRFIDLATAKAAGSIKLGGETVRDFAVLNEARLAVAAGNDLKIVRIDGTVDKTLSLAGPVVAVASLPKGARFFALIAQPAQIADIDGKSFVVKNIPITGANGPTAFALTTKKDALLITDGGKQGQASGRATFRFQLDTGAITPYATVGAGPRALFVDGADVAWIANTVAGTLTVIQPGGSFYVELPTGDRPRGVTALSAKK